MTTSTLGLDAELLNACVSCGLCLPHCPTFRVTGLEIASPRGRIAAMNAVEGGTAKLNAAFINAMDECVQCLGCETACPSGVQFGRLMEGSRTAIVRRRGIRARINRFGGTIAFRWILPSRRALLSVSWVLLVAQRFKMLPKRLRSSVPHLSRERLRESLNVTVGGSPDVWLFTGCVMDVWMRQTHVATAAALRSTGARVARPDQRAGCCGALASHAGRPDEAMRQARNVMAAMPGDAPIIVNSAGCGAALKDYGHLIGDASAEKFAARVFDVSEWLVLHSPLQTEAGSLGAVVVQDPCHLRNVQRAHGAVRSLLSGAYELLETADDALCCGAGGSYAAMQPELSQMISDQKASALRTAGASEGVSVCSSNPGCTLMLEAAGFSVVHPVELFVKAIAATRTETANG